MLMVDRKYIKTTETHKEKNIQKVKKYKVNI